MKRLALTPDELNLVFEHRRRKAIWNEALDAVERKLKPADQYSLGYSFEEICRLLKELRQ